MAKIFSCDWLHHCDMTAEEIEARRESRQIDRMLAKEKLKLKQEVKILVVGLESSGKTTVCRAMRAKHGDEFTVSEKMAFRNIIYKNVLETLLKLINGRVEFNLPWESSINEYYAQTIVNITSSPCSDSIDPSTFNGLADIINSLWRDEAIQRVYRRHASVLNLNESMGYFFDRLDALTIDNYLPSIEDILHCHEPTRGMSEYQLKINEIPFIFLEPSSLVSSKVERFKWVSLFENVVSAILFVVASSEYDQETSRDGNSDGDVNQISEALDMFSSIVNHPFFRYTPVIMYFNKTDILREKCRRLSQLWEERNREEERLTNERLRDELVRDLRSVDPKDKGRFFHERCCAQARAVLLYHSLPYIGQYYYSDRSGLKRYISYEGIKTYKDYWPMFSSNPFEPVRIQRHMIRMFKLCRSDKSKKLYFFFTTAVDINNVQTTWTFILKNIILKKNINQIRLN